MFEKNQRSSDFHDFSDPMTCLNPFMTIGKQLAEPLIYHEKLRRGQARDLSIELLKEVELGS